MEDLKERVFGASDAAAAMATVLARDPGFDMGRLLAGVKKDAPTVRFEGREGRGTHARSRRRGARCSAGARSVAPSSPPTQTQHDTQLPTILNNNNPQQ